MRKNNEVYLSKKDQRFLNALAKINGLSQSDILGRIFGWFALAAGCAGLIMWLITGLFRPAAFSWQSADFVSGLIFILAGWNRLMEFRYRRIIKYMLDKNPEVVPAPNEN